MGFAGKIINKRVKKYIDKHFYNYNAIKAGIAKAKLEREDPGAATGNIGYQLPDPTGNKAIKNASEITRISIITDRGEPFTVHYPERWLNIMKDCFYHYRGEMIGDMVVDRYITHKIPDATAGLLRIDRSTYYDWLDSFLYDAAILAATQKLIDGSFKESCEENLFQKVADKLPEYP